MRKIILNLAISLDGYIADNNGGFEWIKGEDTKGITKDNQFDFPNFLDSLDIIVMGSNAYQDTPKESKAEFKDKKILLATSRNLKVPANVEIISADVCSRVLELKNQDGKDIWLFGGGILVDEFIKADIIDEYIIGIIPTILGSGRKLFLDNNPTLKLHLKESSVTDGVVMLTYSKREV